MHGEAGGTTALHEPDMMIRQVPYPARPYVAAQPVPQAVPRVPLVVQGLGASEGRIFRCTFDRQGGYEAGKQFLAVTPRPTAVFISSDISSSAA